MYKLRRISLTLLLSMLCLVTFAQKNLTGSVKDSNGDPMIGVTVKVKGTSFGAATDLNGNFTLQNVKNDAQLVFSYIGCATQTVSTNGRTNITVVMKDDSKSLDDVVVIGYGTMKKRDLTGSVASVNSDKLTAIPVADVSQALQGKLPGVSVTSQDGRPGANVSIRVRGGGSITQSNDPLFIVDGVPTSSISEIPAEQIESIDVLKDASSTAIYGARGANGVILVTTKGAKEGKVRVSYSGYMQINKAAKTLKGQDAQDYVEDLWSYGAAMQTVSGSYGDAVAKCFGLGSAYGNHFNDYANVNGHNWTDDLLRTTTSWNHNISISGGTDKTQMVFNAGYLNDKGIKDKSGFSRWNIDLKLKQKLLKNLTFDADVRYHEVEVQGSDGMVNSRGSALSYAYAFCPIEKFFGDGDYNTGFGNGGGNLMDPAKSPLAVSNDITSINDRQALHGTFDLTWEIIKGLTYKTELGVGRNWSKSKYWDGGLVSDWTKGYSYAKLGTGDGWRLSFTNTLNYQVQGLSKAHNLSVLLGSELLASKSDSQTMVGANYPITFDMNQAFGMIGMYAKNDPYTYFNNSVGIPNKTKSWFGRANYAYLDRYLITATLRADGSSKFAPNKQWGYFPAAAFAWRIIDEPFMKSTTEWLSNLKLRLSYGEAGSDNINSSLWQETYDMQEVITNGQSGLQFSSTGLKSNPNLKWETTVSRNIGVDFGLFNNRLSGSVDFYWNYTKDLLMKVPIDASTGYSYQYQNVGRTSNKGIELGLNYDIINTKDFSLNISGTYNYNKNNIDELADGVTTGYSSKWASSATQPLYDYAFRVGSPVGLIRGYKCDGFYTTNDFNYDAATKTYTLKDNVPDEGTFMGTYNGRKNFLVKKTTKDSNGAATTTDANAFPGAVKIHDENGDGKIDENDITDLGKVTPAHTGGFNIAARYKNVDFGATFTYAFGGHVYNATALSSLYGNKDNSFGCNRLDIANKCYKIYSVENGELHPLTTPEELNAANAGAEYWLPYYENGVTLSTFVERSDYLRLNTLTIGYTLPKSLTSKIGIQRCRIYATASNVFCITGYSGLDPEVNTKEDMNSSEYPTIGLDFGSYPRSRSFTFGLNLDF
ncbi:TonB-linked outer membrane protein, SusC/RagA family [Xylanibacter oryzae DSM 17970]|uniref:TonB-linked outer membrane protein, SusC/RagA family n=1 Tax=Xylanibacter oryzae DSM 17970 TaxID=915438 RepID=A0ABN0RU14_9BACT|nr:TonB-dependent receptor [Xylanibacter oryzae]EXG77730.1 TonB-linked outer membrane protein, SusC/RagA family [Xylanibacter oryzae DSM 17970]